MNIDGGCHCGFIRYQAQVDPRRVIICHCTDCQALSGSAYRTVMFIPEDRFTLLEGKLRCYTKIADSGAPRAQMFCPECGTQIYATSTGEGPRSFGVRVGTARQRAQLVPVKQYWCDSALGWVQDLSSIPNLHS